MGTRSDARVRPARPGFEWSEKLSFPSEANVRVLLHLVRPTQDVVVISSLKMTSLDGDACIDRSAFAISDKLHAKRSYRVEYTAHARTIRLLIFCTIAAALLGRPPPVGV